MTHRGLTCPTCHGPVEAMAEHNAIARTFGAMVLSDLVGWSLAGLFVIVGLVWWPGYIFGAGAVLWLIVRQTIRRSRYHCARCNENFSYDTVSPSGGKTHGE